MSSKCPKLNSCGADLPYWTDEPMPTALHTPQLIRAYASQSYDQKASCKIFTLQVEVMKCSSSTGVGYIYRYNGTYSNLCSAAFCGMNQPRIASFSYHIGLAIDTILCCSMQMKFRLINVYYFFNALNFNLPKDIDSSAVYNFSFNLIKF